MYNSDGYILIDLTGVDITKTNQYLKGIFNRVISVIDTNKLAIVINAGELTPMAAIVRRRLNYYVITTNLYIFTINSNDIIIIEEAGETTVDVSIVPTLLSGIKVADFSIGATEGSIYVPEQQTEINDNTVSDHTTWSSDKLSDELVLKANISSLATVATSGNYDDLTNKPNIPKKTSDLVNDSGFITTAQVPVIDDNTVASDKVWSSYKTSAELENKANISTLADYQPKTDNNLSTTDKTVVGAINENKSVIGYNYDAYDDTATYAVGDLCIHNNALYKCTTAITTAEAWNASHWAQTSIADEINELNSNKQDSLVIDNTNSSSAISLNGTYQIPQSVLDHTFVLVGVRRAGLGNYSIFKTTELLQYDNGFTLLATGGGYVTLKCSSTGLLTVTNITNMNDPYIFVSGIL